MTTLNLDIDFKTPMMYAHLSMRSAWASCWCRFRRCATRAFRRRRTTTFRGMTNLARNLGGSLGIASISIMLSRRSQFHQTVLVSNITGVELDFARPRREHGAQLRIPGPRQARKPRSAPTA